MTDEDKLIVPGLRWCVEHEFCEGCPAEQTCRHGGSLIESQAADLIEFQAQEFAQLQKIVKDVANHLDQVWRERDAAVIELKESVDACTYCKKHGDGWMCSMCGECTECCGWEWRGPKEERRNRTMPDIDVDERGNINAVEAAAINIAPAVDATPKWHDARKEPPEEYTEGLLVIVSGKPLENVRFDNTLQLASYAPGEGWIIEGWEEWEDPDVSWWQIPQLPEGIEVVNK